MAATLISCKKARKFFLWNKYAIKGNMSVYQSCLRRAQWYWDHRFVPRDKSVSVDFTNTMNVLTSQNSVFLIQAACTCFQTLRVYISITLKQQISVYVLSVASFPGALEGSLILAQVDKCSGKMCPVGNAAEEQLGSLIKLILEAFLSNNQYVCDVHHT